MKTTDTQKASNSPASFVERAFLSLVSERYRNMTMTPPPVDRDGLISRMISIERGVMFRGALAGAACGCACALGVELAEPLWIENPKSFWDMLPYYSLSLGIGAVATVFEIAFLFWDGARSAVAMGSLAEVLKEDENEDLEKMELSLLRAGLETPPPSTVWRGIDPLFQSSRLRILIVTLLYKLKIAGTSALVKGLFRKIVARLSGRVVARSVVELAAIPVFAMWNAFICRKVMREARVRALGPSFAEEVYEIAFPKGFSCLDEAVQKACIMTIREQIVATSSRHPNLARMGYKLFTNDSVTHLDEADQGGLASTLSDLESSERKMVFEFLLVICALDGKVCTKERRMLRRLGPVVGLDSAEAINRAKSYAESVMDGRTLRSGEVNFVFE